MDVRNNKKKKKNYVTITQWQLLVPLSKMSIETFWEQKKMPVPACFSFSLNVFYPMKDKFNGFVTFNLSSANTLSLDKASFFFVVW